MSLSRFRLRLTAWFGAAFIVGLLVLDAGFYLYSRQRADNRIRHDLATTARGLDEAIRAEAAEFSGDPSAGIRDAIQEWPAGPEALLVWQPSGQRLGARGPERLLQAATRTQPPPSGLTVQAVTLDRGPGAIVAIYRDSLPGAPYVAAILSTFQTHEENEVLLGWLLVSLPLVALLALAGGYVLARRALTPVRELSERVAGIDPSALDQRLPVRTPPDEIDNLADQFNRLLQRLEQAQATNRTFLARAAHQLKTPLTVVRGESALGLERSRDVTEYEAILRRILVSADQMSRRVAELLLLARATAGDRPPLTDQVELDGLIWQCADLMRARAQATQHQLELGSAEPIIIHGNEDLLREACLELIENACRHATPGTAIRISVRHTPADAAIIVASQGKALDLAAQLEPRGSEGTGRLGLTIVDWIATVHGGRLTVTRDGLVNLITLHLPAPPLPEGAPA